MNPFWSYLWPLLCAGFAAGAVGGWFGFRRQRKLPIIIAVVAAIAAAAAWHGPLGAADRFTATIERQSREALDYYEMPTISAHLHRRPLTRQLVLAGRADDFQTAELARLLGQLPGVRDVGWSDEGEGLPMIVEAMLAVIGGFLAGLLLAYLIELRRRYNAQWSW